jgi:hypothetical protein
MPGAYISFDRLESCEAGGVGTRMRISLSAGWLAAVAFVAACPGGGSNGGGQEENGEACVLLAAERPGEVLDAERWPDGCFVPFDGETYAFNVDHTGWTDLSFERGILATWDADRCDFCSFEGQPTETSTDGKRCVQHFNCGIEGRCAVRLYIDEATNRWRFDFDGWGCTAPPGTYDLFPTGDGECVGVCATSRQCGDDGCGTSCGSCTSGEVCDSGRCRLVRNEACDACLSTCSGYAQCCSGCGCFCESECGGCW